MLPAINQNGGKAANTRGRYVIDVLAVDYDLFRGARQVVNVLEEIDKTLAIVGVEITLNVENKSVLSALNEDRLEIEPIILGVEGFNVEVKGAARGYSFR